MTIAYYPGCTLKNKAQNLELTALAVLREVGIEVHELERWNCCGAVFSLADDDLIHLVAPVRDLIRAKDSGATTLMTLCAQCYNVLARANQVMRSNDEKRKTLNLFMDEETDYHGEVEVVHYLDLLRTSLGWAELRKRVKVPLTGLRVAPFYGCATIRPLDVAVGGGTLDPAIFRDFIAALGATPVEYPGATECCGAYETLANPTAAIDRSGQVLSSAQSHGADAIVLTCPLCEYNLGKKQPKIREAHPEVRELPVYYFTQLLAIALGLDPETCHFELNMAGARSLLADRKLIGAAVG
jgi:heterodisulfide reductase subunit B